MENVSRRGLLAGACALLAIGPAALPAAAQTAIKRLPDGRVEVRLKGVPQLAAVGGAVQIGNVKGVPVGVSRTGANTYVAFNLRCPHAGVVVGRSAKGWACAAHGSEFEPDGDLVLGPATKGLTRVPTRLSRGTLIVG